MQAGWCRNSVLIDAPIKLRNALNNPRGFYGYRIPFHTIISPHEHLSPFMDPLKEAIRLKGRPPVPPKRKVMQVIATENSAVGSRKRGLGWPWDQPSSHFQLFFPPSQASDNSSADEADPGRGISWIFNWELWAPADLPKTIEWVPCVRTAGQVGDILPFLSDIKSKGRTITHLLGFNEPEIPSQANLSVSEAVRLWKEYILPAKTQLGLRLGSTGMCSNTSISIPWLDQFFLSFSSQSDGELENNLREGIMASGVEFLVLHWYGLSPKEMITFLDNMHTRYHLPIWLNEFACSRMGSDGAESTEAEVRGFLHEAVPWLEDTTWIERYSFFGLAHGQSVGSWVGEKNNLTQVQHDKIETGGFGLSEVGKLYVQL